MSRKRAPLVLIVIVLVGCAWESFVAPPTRPVCEVGFLEGTCLGAESEETVSPDRREPATIAGRVIYEADPKRRWRYSRYYIKDRKRGELAEAVVALRGKTLKNLPVPATLKTWEMDQKNVRFAPEILAIRAGERVKFTNSDAQVHNIHADSPLVRFDRTIAGDQEALQTFKRAGGVKRPIVLGCKLHSAMRAWIFVFDHPFFQLTRDDGEFRFENVPQGDYKLEMAHPAGELQKTRTITIMPGEHVELEIRVSPDDRVQS